MEKSGPPLETEIKITDDMVDAGLAAWDDADPRYMRRSSIVVSIYRAMAALASKLPEAETSECG